MRIMNYSVFSDRRLRVKPAMTVAVTEVLMFAKALAVAFVFALCFALSACHPNGAKGGEVIVKVGDNVLTMEDLYGNVQSGDSPEDSMLMTEHYIKLWINNQLLYDVARKNTTRDDELEINHLVENYKKSLTIYRYQEQLVSEKLAKEISDAELEKYYTEHQSMFKSLLPEDSTTSFEYIKPTVREMVVNRQKMDFLKNVEADLYDRAVKNGMVIFYK